LNLSSPIRQRLSYCHDERRGADIKSAADLPDAAKIAEIREPWIKGEIVVPQEYVGAIIQLVASKRGLHKNLSYVDTRALISFEAPLANLLTDFYDSLKSLTSGYGSFSYELDDYRTEDLVRVDFYVAGEKVDALGIWRTAAKHKVWAVRRWKTQRSHSAAKLPSFDTGSHWRQIYCREDLSAYRKDVTTGLYGGDVSRKKKVLAKQAKGKKRLKRFGKVDIPAEAFTVLLKRD